MLQRGPRAIVAAFADTLFPAEPDAPAGSEVVIDGLEDLMAGMLAEARSQLLMGLNLLDMGAVPLMRGRFCKLPRPKREQYLRSCATSRIALPRTLYASLRNLVATLYYADPRTWQHIQYSGPQIPARAEREVSP